MKAESHLVPVHLPWLPASGHQLRRAGVHFDAVRVAGPYGLRAADQLEKLTTGGPGPVVAEEAGERPLYFLVPPGSTARRPWPPGVHRITGDGRRPSYIGVPALYGPTWPLSWRCPPAPGGHLVHPLLLHATLCALSGWEPPGGIGGLFAPRPSAPPGAPGGADGT